MNTLTLSNHKILVRLLSKVLGKAKRVRYPTANVVNHYVQSAYLFKEWAIDIDARGCVFIYPTALNPHYNMYKVYNCKRKMVAVWLHLGAWGDSHVSRSPEDVAKNVLATIKLIDNK